MKKENNQKQEISKKQGDTKSTPFKKLWFWVLVIIISVVITGNNSDKKKDTASSSSAVTNTAAATPTPSAVATPAPTTAPVETPPPSFATLEEEVSYKLGKEISKDLIKGVSLDEAESDLYVTLEMSDNLTTNLTKMGIESAALQVFKHVYPIIKDNDKVNMITYCSETMFVDSYGNEEADNACIISMTKETLQKINWDNFQKENLETVATTYFMHPSLIE